MDKFVFSVRYGGQSYGYKWEKLLNIHTVFET